MGDANDSKEIPESVFSDDDGTADARLAQALIRHASGRAPLADVVEALAYARVLVPVMASGEVRAIGPHGLERDSVASTGVVALQMPDGREALPIFTDVDAMKAWKPEARPVPAEGPRAALAAVAEQWSAMILNPGMESTVIPRPAVWAIAQGEAWLPAVVNGVLDAEIRDAVIEAVVTDDQVLRVDARAGTASEVAVILFLASGLTADEFEAVVSRVQADLAHAGLLARRVDSIQLTIESAEG